MESGRTSNKFLARVALAQMVNRISGGAVIAPWDVDGLPEVWLDVFRALSEDMPSMAKAKGQVQKIKNAWLQRHPTYGK